MNRDEIARLIPHAGPMCLLDELVCWTDHRIHCRSRTHRDPDHPLAVNGRLPDTALVEYAAQAVALHGSLLARTQESTSQPSPGRLVALKNIQLPSDERDLSDELVLDIHAERELHGTAGMIYAFRVLGQAHTLATGQLTIRLGL